MTPAEATRLAHIDPLANLTHQTGELATEIRAHVDKLAAALRALDKGTAALAERGVKIEVDLGPIGNAAAAARRDLETRNNEKPFVMPRA